MLSNDRQDVAMNAICHEAFMARQAFEIAACEAQRPSVLYRPTISVDGDKWCALYGQNLQDGVAGFGNSPYEAMTAFDRAWTEKLTGNAAISKHGG